MEFLTRGHRECLLSTQEIELKPDLQDGEKQTRGREMDKELSLFSSYTSV